MNGFYTKTRRFRETVPHFLSVDFQPFIHKFNIVSSHRGPDSPLFCSVEAFRVLLLHLLLLSLLAALHTSALKGVIIKMMVGHTFGVIIISGGMALRF